MRERRLDEIDYDNLIEELKAIVRSDKNALTSNLRVLLMHLLKWEYQSQKRTNSWRYSIVEHCFRINEALEDSPSLKPYFDDVFDKCYEKARALAAAETGMKKNQFPLQCPFSKEYVLNTENSFADLGEEDYK